MRALLVGLLLVLATSVARADDAIAFGDGGLRVGAAVIYDKPVTAAAHDPAMDLVWFVSKGMLQVIDLRDARHKPVVIAKKFPEVGFSIDGPSKAEFNTAYTPAFAVVKLGKKSKISAEEGAYGPVDQASTDKMKKSIKKAKVVVAKKWLSALAKRSLRAVTIPTPAAEPKVTLPADLCQGDDPDECGSAISFGATSLQLVTTEYSCGDACYTSCVLYDPGRKAFVDPTDAQSSWDARDAKAGACDGYYFDGDGKTYYNGNLRCTLGKDVTCTDDTPWTYVGITPPAAPPPASR